MKYNTRKLNILYAFFIRITHIRRFVLQTWQQNILEEEINRDPCVYG
jgi:hypothetical protein